MGEWFDYGIKFANKEENLAELMARKGLATITQELLSLNLKEINPEMFATGYRPDDNFEHITIGFDENAVYYTNKWVPDDRLSIAISKQFPNDVLEISREYTGGCDDIIWYSKDGKNTTKNGNSLITAIYSLNSKLCKDIGKFYKISLPIGEENDKWGSITISKDNVNHLEWNTSVYFDMEEINVTFKSGIVKMNTKELVEKFYDSKRNYNNDMHSLIKITGLPRANFRKKDNYYIVKIFCPQDISSNGYISITVPDYDVDINNGAITLGEKGKSRSVQITSQTDGIIRDRFSNPFIKECYEKAMRNLMQGRQDENIEEEIEKCE